MIKRKTILTLTVLAAQLLFAPGCVQPGPAALCFHPFHARIYAMDIPKNWF
jgi:hypothetical protein